MQKTSLVMTIDACHEHLVTVVFELWTPILRYVVADVADVDVVVTVVEVEAVWIFQR